MIATEFKIPEGYALVPKEWMEQFFNKVGWVDIETPNIKETADYVGVSVHKIKKDLNKIGCPLREVSSGGVGRGNMKKFAKQSVEQYKNWI